MSCNYFDGLSRQVSTAFKGIFLSFILGVFFFLAGFFPKTLSLLRFETDAAVSAKRHPASVRTTRPPPPRNDLSDFSKPSLFT